MAVEYTGQFDPDLPIKNSDEDELSFAPFAASVAEQILAYKQPTSFVVGVTAPWGAGKTSLVNLIVEAVETLAEDNSPLIVFPYSPWIVGNRDALLAEFLPQLSQKIESAVPKKFRSKRFGGAILALRRYSRGLKGVESGLSIAASTATIFGFPAPIWLQPLTSLVGKVAGSVGLGTKQPHSLDELRDAARDALQQANIRLLVVLDDLDRLEPSEVLDLIRMVRSTAELPLITYLLSYDQDRVAISIQNQLGVSGADYLEKVVQLPISVPEASSFDLAQILGQRISHIFRDSAESDEQDKEQSERLSRSLWRDVRELALKTPRDVSRLSTSVSFAWNMLGGNADPDDLFLVSVFRTKYPAIHLWMKHYSHAFHSEFGGFDSEKRSKVFVGRLRAACEVDEAPFDDVYDTLMRVLPGMSSGFAGNDPKCFQSWNLDESQSARRDKRLASEDHWISYFDLSTARFPLTDKWLSDFLRDAAHHKSKAVDALVALGSKPIVSGGYEAERVLGRIRAEAKGNKLNEEQRIALFHVVADAADDLMTLIGPPGFWQASVFSQAAWVSIDLLSKVSAGARANALVDAIHQGKSVSWLMYFFRYEMMSHGRIGDETKDRDALLSSDQLDALETVVRERIDSLIDSDIVFDVSDPVYVFLAWRDLSDDKDSSLLDWIAANTKDDEAFLTFVEAFSSIVRSTDGDYWRIQTNALGDFVNVDEAIARAITLSDRSGAIGDRAREVKRRFDATRDF